MTVNSRHLSVQRHIISRKKHLCLQFTKRRSLLLSQINRNQFRYKTAKKKKDRDRKKRRKRIQSREKGRKKHRKQNKERSRMTK